MSVAPPAVRSASVDDARGVWPGRRLELAGLTLLLLAFAASCGFVLAQPTILEHDESVYAVMARHWLAGTPDTGVAAHRAPLLPAVGLPVLALGGGELGLRLVGVVSGMGLVVATWWAGRLVGGPLAGLGAGAVVAVSPVTITQSSRFMTDVGAAGLLVALAALLWWQLGQRGAPDRRLLLAAPLAWAAYELRFGSALVVVLLVATAAVMCRAALRRRPALVAATLGLLALLLLPHLVNSTADVGTPWGRVVYTSEVAGREYLGQGLVEYVRWFPVELAGPLAAVLMSVALVATPLLWWRRDPHRRAFAFFVVPAVLDVILIGIASHGEARFVLWSVSLLCAVGAAVVARVVALIAARRPAAAVALVAVAGIAAAGQMAVGARWGAQAADRHRVETAAFVEAMDAISGGPGADGAGGASTACSVLTSYTPQVTWRTGCASYHFGIPPVPGRESQLTGDAWMLLREDGKRQPRGDVADHYLDLASDPGRTFSAPGADDARLLRLDRLTAS